MNNIIIYKASAGSGKTYKLVYMYVKYLFVGQTDYLIHRRNWVTNVHRSILAVTFTNKATIEMKNRIVAALSDMSQPLPTGCKVQYENWLRTDVAAFKSVDSSRMSEVAKYLLSDLLNDYTMFRVQTIDGFFQQVVRSFANDLNLDTGYKVELDGNAVIENSVDTMLGELDAPDNKDLLHWLTEFVNDRVSENSGWNPRADIIRLANYINSESYKSYGQRATKQADYKQCRDILVKTRKQYEDDLQALCNEAQVALSEWEADRDKFNRNAISSFDYTYLKKKKFQLTATFTKAVGNGSFFKSTVKRSGEHKDVEARLADVGSRIVGMCSEEAPRSVEYNTICHILGNFYVLGILNRIHDYVIRYCRENDAMILASTSELIDRIIGDDGNNPSFIYERVGVMTEHFMIDEFQDTSRLQWKNFVPLIAEAVSRGSESMIVGDVKQSIYRWRNGDWHILYDGVSSRFSGDVDVQTLNTNFRSAANVVSFNNYIYSQIPRDIDAVLTPRLKNIALRFQDVYDNESVVQQVNSSEKGYVRCKFIEPVDKAVPVRTLEECSLDDMVAELQKLKSAKGNYSGIAVLGRKNGELVRVAERLLAVEPEPIPFCSSEALSVADNDAVRFIIAVLRYSVKPYEAIYRAELLVCYKCLFVREDANVTASDFPVMYNPNYSEFAVRSWEKMLLSGYLSAANPSCGDEDFLNRFYELKYLPLQRAVDNIVTLFDLNNVAAANTVGHRLFIRSFIDTIHDYCLDNVADTYTFLNYWDEQGGRIYVPIPESLNSVILCTIHKSKGLEFDTVFLPFVNFKMGISTKINNFIFCDYPPSVPGYGLIPFVPVNLKRAKSLMTTWFAPDVFREFLDCCLDELNVLYVATTRAKLQLYINAVCANPTDGGKTTGTIDRAADFIEELSVADMLKSVVSQKYSEAGQSDCSSGEIQSAVYEIGTPKVCADAAETVGAEVVSDYSDASVSQKDSRLNLRFTNIDGQDNGSVKAQETGIVMHRIFEQLKRSSDVASILQRAKADGLLDSERYDKIRAVCDRLMQTAEIAQLFDNEYNVVTEAEIWDPRSKRTYRPDRLMFDEQNHCAVVVDYKFGERTKDNDARYTSQVAEYMRLIADMGYTVKGFILYTFRYELLEVKL